MGLAVFVASWAVLMVFRPISAEINCENDVHENCPSNALYTTITEIAEFSSEKIWQERCSGIIEDISCKSNYLHTCDYGNYKLYSLMTNGLKDLFSELCNETSEIRIGYRQHIDCFRRSSTQLRVCLYMSLEADRPLGRNPRSPITAEEKVTALCAFQESLRTCTVDVAKKSCSEEASRYLATIYSKILDDLVTEIC